MQKGLNNLLSAVFLVLIVVAVSVIVFSWSNSLSNSQIEDIQNTTAEQLGCQYADIYIRSATFNCSGNCLSGSHNLSVVIRNNGKRSVTVNAISLTNSTGSTFTYAVPVTTIRIGEDKTLINISTANCTAINMTIDKVIVSSTNCPGTAYDSLPGTYVNYLSC